MMQELEWRIHTPNLLKEIVDYALPRNSGMLKFPLNQFRRRLLQLAELAREIDDPRLHLWCYQMALYEEGDPGSKDYNPDAPAILKKKIEKLRKRVT